MSCSGSRFAAVPEVLQLRRRKVGWGVGSAASRGEMKSW